MSHFLSVFGHLIIQLIEISNAIGLPPGSSLKNPIDIPANGLYKTRGKIIKDLIEEIPRDLFGVILLHLNMESFYNYPEPEKFLQNIIQAFDEADSTAAKVLVLVSSGSTEMTTFRNELVKQSIAAGIPVASNLVNVGPMLDNIYSYTEYVNKEMSKGGVKH